MIFSVFYLIEVLIWRGTFCWQPHLSGPVVPKLWAILKDSLNNSKNKRNWFLFLAISHNQCSWLPTDSARSQHILCCQYCQTVIQQSKNFFENKTVFLWQLAFHWSHWNTAILKCFFCSRTCYSKYLLRIYYINHWGPGDIVFNVQ